MAEFDLIIRGGRVVDGTGAAPVQADIAIADGRIAAVEPKISAAARETLDADGHIVTPGWLDIHTHFDGQVTWDDTLDPAFSHGVTTVVMGNCGVGFAPVRPGARDALIDIMEGVEDIPGPALHEAMPWGRWESYAEYLDLLRARTFTMDVGSHISHGALRAYVLGAERTFEKTASPDQVLQMAAIVRDAMRAGCLGVSTNRAIGHRALSGDPVPGTYASEAELDALVGAMADTGAGVLQAMPGGGMGAIEGIGPDWTTLASEIELMGRVSRKHGRPVTYTMLQVSDAPDAWREILKKTVEENDKGAQLYPQVSPRQPALLMSLGGYHPLMRRETYLKIRHLPIPERVAEMRKPEVKAAILSDHNIRDEVAGSTENFLCDLLENNLGRLFPLGRPVCYEPEMSQSVGGLAKARGETEASVFYDQLLEYDGGNVLMLSETNYVYGDFNDVSEMFLHPATLGGLSDAGAHVKFICDASIPTYLLSYFARDRVRGPKMPLEQAVAKLTGRNAAFYGMADRGRIAPGLRADLNVIDFERLSLELPVMHYDLPKRAGRFLQAAHGYRATFVNGVKTRENDEDTGARPGRLVTSAAARVRSPARS